MTLRQENAGNAIQTAVLSLNPGQTAYCEAGEFLSETTNVTMETRLSGPSDHAGRQSGGGMGGMLRQAVGTAMRGVRSLPVRW